LVYSTYIVLGVGAAIRRIGAASKPLKTFQNSLSNTRHFVWAWNTNALAMGVNAARATPKFGQSHFSGYRQTAGHGLQRTS